MFSADTQHASARNALRPRTFAFAGQRPFRLFLRIAVLLVCTLSFPGVRTATAQTTNGQISGTLTDPSGAVVPGAQIDVLNQTTGQHRLATSADSGSYNIPQLPPGTYTVTATRGGFGTQTKTGLYLEVNQNATLDFTFTPSGDNTTISVSSAPPLLDEQTATLGDVINHQQVVDLPLNGRSFTQLTLLTPGAAPQGSNQQRAFTVQEGSAGISPAVNGQRPQQNNYTMDGTLNNSLYINTWAIDPPPDALREFNVQSHITDAQFAISSGANINLVTASGGRQYHGALWEFIRNDALDATQNSPGQPTANQKKLPYRQNQYGLVVSGPVPLLRDNTWFSGYWEGFRSVQSFPIFTDVPTGAQRGTAGPNAGKFLDFSAQLGAQQTNSNGTPVLDGLGRPVFSGEIYDPNTQRFLPNGKLIRDPFPGNLIPINRLNAASQAILTRYYPLPNINVQPGHGGDLFFPGANRTSNDKYGVRIDHRFGNNDSLFGRYNSGNLARVTPENVPTFSGSAFNKAKQVSIGYTHLFGQKIVLDLRYGFTRTDNGQFDDPAGAAIIAATNFAQTFPPRNGVELGPWIVLQSYAGVQQNYLPLGPQTNHDGHVDVSINRGKHTIGAGLMLYHVHSFDDGYQGLNFFFNTGTSVDGSGGPSGDGAASFLLGVQHQFSSLSGDTAADITTFWKGGYVQDQWQATPNLTLTAGLRYDYVPPPVYTNVVSGLDINNGQFSITRPAPGFPKPVGEKNYVKPQYNGFEPRFGVAYKATDRTVLRSAFAMLDDHNNTLVQEAQDLRVSWPRAQGVNLFNLDTSTAGGPQYTFGNLPTNASFFAGLQPFIAYDVDPKNKIPYSMQYNFGVEQQLNSQTVVNLDYVGSVSRHQFVQGAANTALTPGPGSYVSRGQPFPQYGGPFQYDLNEGTANYNALQVKVHQALSHGLTYLASYTYSKSLDEESEGQAGSITNLFNLRQDYGPSDFDVRHIVVLSPVYQLPFGRGRDYYSNAGHLSDLLVGGWNVSTIFTFYSGLPFNIGVSDSSAANVGANAARANRVPGVNPYGTRNGLQFLNPAAFAIPTTPSSTVYSYGNEGRNDLNQPHRINDDFSLFKDFHITERLNFQFRSEFFNVFNHPNIVGPDTNINNPSHFGVLGGAGAPREIQFAGKITF